MRIFSKPSRAKMLCWLLLAFLFVWNANAQSDNDKQNATSFIDSMAQTVYKLAWPTATYREMSYGGFEPAGNGFDVLVKLSGNSGLDGSDLWLRLAFMFRDGKFYDIRVKDDNAFWVPPFTTTKFTLAVAASLAQQYADQQKAQAGNTATPPPTPSYRPAPAPTPVPAESPAAVPATDIPVTTAEDPNSPSAEGTCLSNSTSSDVSFDYRWGDGTWDHYKLSPNQVLRIWWKYAEGGRPSPQLVVRYEDDGESPPVERAYDLDRAPTTQPPSCETLTKYKFRMDGVKTILYTGAP